MTSPASTLDRLPDRDAFDRFVGPDITAALARLEAIEQELANAEHADSVAAMTARMQLDDERDALHADLARSLLTLRGALGG